MQSRFCSKFVISVSCIIHSNRCDALEVMKIGCTLHANVSITDSNQTTAPPTCMIRCERAYSGVQIAEDMALIEEEF